MKLSTLIIALLMAAPLSAEHSAPAGVIPGDKGQGLVNINGNPQGQGSGTTRPIVPNPYAIQAASQANVAGGNHPGVSPGDASGFGRNLPQNTYVAGAQGAAFANQFAVKFGHHPIIGLAHFFRTIRGDQLTTFLNALEESLNNTFRAIRRGQDTHGEFFFNFHNIHELDDLLYVLDEFIRTGKLPADPHGYTYSDKDTDYVRAKELRNQIAKLIQILEIEEKRRIDNIERQKAIAAHQKQQEQPFPPFPINANVAAADGNSQPPPTFGPPPPPPPLPPLKPLELGGFLTRSRTIDLSFLSTSAAAGRAQLAQETANRQAFQAQMIRILAQTLQTQTVNLSTGLIRGGIPSLWRPVPSYGGPFNPVRFRPTPQTAQTTRQPVGQTTTTTRTTPTLPPTSTLTQRTQTPAAPEQQAFRRGPTYGVRAVKKPLFRSMPTAP